MACQFLLLGSDLDRPLESRKGCPSDMLKNLQEAWLWCPPLLSIWGKLLSRARSGFSWLWLFSN